MKEGEVPQLRKGFNRSTNRAQGSIVIPPQYDERTDYAENGVCRAFKASTDNRHARNDVGKLYARGFNNGYPVQLYTWRGAAKEKLRERLDAAWKADQDPD